MAVFTLTKENENDEIVRYQMGRYINSNEAIWRILDFSIHHRDPAVVHLAIHLENVRRVSFTRETVENVVANPVSKTLTAFFELCSNDPFAKTLLYPEVVSYYTWDVSVYAKCFFLRLLLHKIRGPMSFVDLRNINGYINRIE